MDYQPALVIQQVQNDSGTWVPRNVTAEAIAKTKTGWVSLNGQYRFDLSGICPCKERDNVRFCVKFTPMVLKG